MYKNVIQSLFYEEMKIEVTEIFLTDYFFDVDTLNESIKSEIENYLCTIGINKNHVFSYKTKYRNKKTW